MEHREGLPENHTPLIAFIGFTGTPIELADANTRAVFGDYISVYDIQRAVQDGAIVPIDNESRLAKLALDERERPKSGPDFDEVTESEEVECKEKRNTRWAHFEAMVEHDPATIGGHDANHKVVLLGSAPLPIARGMSESLAGRFERNSHGSSTCFQVENKAMSGPAVVRRVSGR